MPSSARRGSTRNGAPTTCGYNTRYGCTCCGDTYYNTHYGYTYYGYTYRCAHDQPQSAKDAIEFTFLIGMPLVCLSITSLAFAYPIKGERLRLLKEALAAAKAKDASASEDGKDIQLGIARSTGLTPDPAVAAQSASTVERARAHT